MSRHARLLLVGSLLWWAPRPLVAQGDRWDRQVLRSLAQVSRQMPSDGFSRADQSSGALNATETRSFTVPLASGDTYVLAGVCDEDCVELELAVYSENGYEVAAARSAGSTPIVRVIPAASGRFTVRVRMARCDMNPCRYGVVVYRHR